ncbi:MAG TPA: WXG100 family type VII secretion target [Microbacteriaceae bacterium]|nr:WXG100 family type VII secretion target [Microbacteriaceae bacterium]
MSNLNVTYDQMNTVAVRLRAGQSELESKLAELRAAVTELVSNGFTTTNASAAFSASYEQFTLGARQTVGGLEGMSEFLDRAATILRSTDEQLAHSISR